MSSNSSSSPLLSANTIPRDLVAGGVVFLVALPLCLGIALAGNCSVWELLCLGIALASGAPLFSGLLAGIVGGLVVGAISGSHTNVSGPAAGLTAVVAAQIAALGSFEALLLSVAMAGVIQLGFGIVRAGALSAFFPSSVIKGLLAAIGVILILKQIPHLLGHDSDPQGEMSFSQPDKENTFSELGRLLLGEIHPGAIVIGLISIAILILWDRWRPLRTSIVPGPLVVVLVGVAISLWFSSLGGVWRIQASHLVQVPVAKTPREFASFLQWPDFSQFVNPLVYTAAITIAVVASLETLLNLEAIDKLDPQKRDSGPSRELIAQGCGNIVCGLIGGLPVTSVIVRSSVNVISGGQTKLSAVFHGILLLVCGAFFPLYLNMIPLSALAAILLVTGVKLASPRLFRQMWAGGKYQFIPFIVTLVSIILTDLLIGILIGLAVSVLFILISNIRRPVRRLVESRLGGDVTHVELANQVTFLNRAAIDRLLKKARPGSQLLIEATHTDYIDPDVLALIVEFRDTIAPARNVTVNLRGFQDRFGLPDQVQFADYATAQVQDQMTPAQVLEILKEGNRRFRSGNRLSRDFGRQVTATAQGQTPLAVILSCIDSRVPAELVFDLGIGDIFSVRVAGNIVGTKSLGSMEYGVCVAGVRLVLVLEHTRCGAVTSSVSLLCDNQDAMRATGCEHLQSIVDEIAPSVLRDDKCAFADLSAAEQEAFVDQTARRNVQHTVRMILERSTVIREAMESGHVYVAGALYDVKSGEIEFLNDEAG